MSQQGGASGDFFPIPVENFPVRNPFCDLWVNSAFLYQNLGFLEAERMFITPGHVGAEHSPPPSLAASHRLSVSLWDCQVPVPGVGGAAGPGPAAEKQGGAARGGPRVPWLPMGNINPFSTWAHLTGDIHPCGTP